MKVIYYLCLCVAMAVACTPPAQRESPVKSTTIGNQFIDAFYSFNKDSLQSVLAIAQGSQPEILYYQQWAECAHYRVLDRTKFFEANDSTVVFPVTVQDDLMGALGIDFNVTDTFRITLREGKIKSVKTSSNDPQEYYQAKEWVVKNRPDLVEKPCEGIWAGGPTPCECVLGMIKGFAAFRVEAEKSN